MLAHKHYKVHAIIITPLVTGSLPWPECCESQPARLSVSVSVGPPWPAVPPGPECTGLQLEAETQREKTKDARVVQEQ
jgi:hypothetical protein